MKDILKNDKSLNDEVYVLPPCNYEGPNYNIRAIDKYCKEKKIAPSDLTNFELKKFEIQ